ncbi:STY4528 family pathogenicity island replication protein [Xanthobacter autotrophicus]|uniref:STY4528 family pathogenicity island replication protein n=1 Tax=Xanthobacter autotrophicus TaxID=280 RepID=UPI00372D0A88
MGRSERSGSPRSPGDVIERIAQRTSTAPVSAAENLVPSSGHADGIIFSGNRHDSVPRALLLDNRLTPLERNAWQVFRLLLNNDGLSSFPTYDQLAPYLASMPCAARASHETVARALTLLRLTRWISLVRRRRDPDTGRIVGNLYVLHDEPLTPYEVMQLDPEYLGLVSHALDHSSRSIQRIGAHALKEMAEDPMLSGKVLPSRLQVLTRRLAAQGWSETSDHPQAVDSDDSEEGRDGSLRNREHPSSESEARGKPAKLGPLRNSKMDRTVRKKSESIQEHTIPRGRGALRLPERFGALKAEQQNGALAALRTLEAELQQAILDEWDARCRTSVVRNPAGYLFGLIQRGVRGEFNVWAGTKELDADTEETS